MTARAFTWETEQLAGDDVEHRATIEDGAIRWATVTDSYDDDQPYMTGSDKVQPLADFLAEGPIERAPMKVLDQLVQALAAGAPWLEPLRLQTAARDGDLTATRGLVRIGAAYKDAVVRGATPLSAALEAGQLETADALLHAKCNPNVRLAGGATALHVAARSAKTAAAATVLRSLVAAGASIEATTDAGETPLIAGLCGHLCKEGVEILVEDRKAINVAAADGTTALLAESRGWCRPSVVRLLLGAGANVNARSKDGWSALLWAITKHDLWFVKMLIDARADVNVVGQPHKHGQPPRSALALAQHYAVATQATPAAAAQAAIKGKASELASQIVEALKSAGAKATV